MIKKHCVIFSLLSIVIIYGLSGCQQNTKETTETARPVKAILVAQGSGYTGRAFPGRAKASKEVDLSFNVSGTLNQRPVKVGDVVKQGQLIASLDPLEFQARLKSAQADKDRDRSNFERAKNLIKKGFVSEAEYENIQAKFNISSANLDLAQKALSDSVLKAPFQGRIANLYVENYQTVAAKQLIARLLDTSQIEMIIQIPENIISVIPYAKDIKVRFDAFPNREFPATIKEISNEASPQTRTYPVTLKMAQPKDLEILPGMAGSATGRIMMPSNKAIQFTVPAAALFTLENKQQSYVWVIDPKTNQVQRRAVSISDLTSTGVAITKGLKEGEWVVTGGVHSLNDGEKVTILNHQDK